MTRLRQLKCVLRQKSGIIINKLALSSSWVGWNKKSWLAILLLQASTIIGTALPVTRIQRQVTVITIISFLSLELNLILEQATTQKMKYFSVTMVKLALTKDATMCSVINSKILRRAVKMRIADLGRCIHCQTSSITTLFQLKESRTCLGTLFLSDCKLVPIRRCQKCSLSIHSLQNQAFSF